MEKSRAASQFNAYVKSNLFAFKFFLTLSELGLTEKNVSEKYLGTIFTK